jgi:hypothetical protein
MASIEILYAKRVKSEFKISYTINGDPYQVTIRSRQPHPDLTRALEALTGACARYGERQNTPHRPITVTGIRISKIQERERIQFTGTQGYASCRLTEGFATPPAFRDGEGFVLDEETNALVFQLEEELRSFVRGEKELGQAENPELDFEQIPQPKGPTPEVPVTLHPMAEPKPQGVPTEHADPASLTQAIRIAIVETASLVAGRSVPITELLASNNPDRQSTTFFYAQEGTGGREFTRLGEVVYVKSGRGRPKATWRPALVETSAQVVPEDDPGRHKFGRDAVLYCRQNGIDLLSVKPRVGQLIEWGEEKYSFAQAILSVPEGRWYFEVSVIGTDETIMLPASEATVHDEQAKSAIETSEENQTIYQIASAWERKALLMEQLITENASQPGGANIAGTANMANQQLTEYRKVHGRLMEVQPDRAGELLHKLEANAEAAFLATNPAHGIAEAV